MQKLKVTDIVQILAGKDKGKQGKVKTINFKTNRVVVEGVNVQVLGLARVSQVVSLREMNTTRRYRFLVISSGIGGGLTATG